MKRLSGGIDVCCGCPAVTLRDILGINKLYGFVEVISMKIGVCPYYFLIRCASQKYRKNSPE